MTLRTFDSPEFKIDYPSSWEIAPRNSTFPYYSSNTIVVLKPTGETNPLNITYLNISPLPIGTSLNPTAQSISRDNNSLNEIVSEEIAFLQDPESFYGDLNVEILDNNSTTVDKLPAKQFSYLIHELGTFDMETIVVHNDKQYQMHFTTPVLYASETLPKVKQIIQSFKFNT
ncbi:PsbP-related protein [Candidatus Nitrosocosmicus franklandus]|uniref:PsbP C-terminal domain-containing protein n=1 Tax=Candidatus Nitrosocosmicus franklandianus TaxID=1798806 RepID=A0A484ICS8_9ARCH|nr:PsbP-related protein [Candidatus Nitrosocosmicus franklandus]VFJ14910.1 conserved protein of unknown function [Candidatus Nitrosocosmicus franklandus]